MVAAGFCPDTSLPRGRFPPWTTSVFADGSENFCLLGGVSCFLGVSLLSTGMGCLVSLDPMGSFSANTNNHALTLKSEETTLILLKTLRHNFLFAYLALTITELLKAQHRSNIMFWRFYLAGNFLIPGTPQYKTLPFYDLPACDYLRYSSGSNTVESLQTRIM